MRMWIVCIVTLVALVAGLTIATTCVIKKKNAEIEKINKELDDAEEAFHNVKTAYDLVVENHEDNKRVEEVVEDAKKTVDDKVDDADWLNQCLPDGVRNIFVECACALDNPAGGAVSHSAGSRNDGYK